MLKRFFKKFSNKLPTRLKVGLMMFVGSCIIYMLRSNFSIILIAMTENEYNWSNHDQNLLLSGYFYGYLLPNLCGGFVAERYGGKIVIFIVLFLSSIITALSPLTANDNFWYLFAARVTLGFLGVSENFLKSIQSLKFLSLKLQGFYFCTCHNLISRWAPPNEKGMFVASLFGSSLGTAFTFPLMGFITDNYSWESAFYVTAIITLITSLLWFHFVADSPDKHISISHAERNLIEESLELNVISRKEFPPVSEMFKSKPFYALLWLHFSDVWGIYFILTSAPMFLSQVLKYELKDVGLISSLPYIIRMASAIIFGGIGDFIWSKKLMTVTGIRKLFCIFCEQDLQRCSKMTIFNLFSSCHSWNYPFRFLLH